MSWLTGGGKSGHLESWTAERRGQGTEQKGSKAWGCQILGGLETVSTGPWVWVELVRMALVRVIPHPRAPARD